MNKNCLPKNETTVSITNVIKNSLKKIEWKLIDGKRKWIRNCPSCNNEILYSSKYHCLYAKKSNTKCLSCALSGNSNNLGNSHSKEAKEKIKRNRVGKGIGNSYWLGKTHSLQTKIKIGLAHKGKTRSSESKLKMRQAALDRIVKNNLIGRTNYNPLACRIFDEINKFFGWNGRHAENFGEFQVLGYSLDYYEPSLNIVIEYDEKYHEKQVEKDLKRQRDIIEHLNCKFYRIKYNQNWKHVLHALIK